MEDSVLATVTKRTRWEKLPPSKVVVSFPAGDLPALPDAAGYHAKDGRASVDVTRDGDMIYVTASCDSLERRVEHFESLYYRSCEALERQNQQMQQLQQQPRASPVKTVIKWFSTGFLAGIAITFLIKTIKSKQLWQVK